MHHRHWRSVQSRVRATRSAAFSRTHGGRIKRELEFLRHERPTIDPCQFGIRRAARSACDMVALRHFRLCILAQAIRQNAVALTHGRRV